MYPNDQSKIYEFDPITGQFITKFIQLKPESTKEQNKINGFSSNVFDVLMLVIICNNHGQILLKQFSTEKNLYFLPIFPFKFDSSWIDSLRFYLTTLLIDVSIEQIELPKIILINQIKMPKFGEILNQIVIHIEIINCANNCLNECKNVQLRWYKLNELNQKRNEFYGPEVYLYSNKNYATFTELSIWIELKNNVKEWKIVTDSEYNDDTINLVFEEYIQQTYPSLFMNWERFSDYLNRTKIDQHIIGTIKNRENLFNAFLGKNFNIDYLCFKNFFLTLIAMDRRCNHGLIGGEYRAYCIFRYYTKPGAQIITNAELNKMLQDINNNKQNNNQTLKNISSKTTILYHHKEKEITLIEFINLLGSLKIRGAATLFRLKIPFLSVFKNKKIYPSLLLQPIFNNLHLERINQQLFQFKCQQCMPQTYSMNKCQFNLKFQYKNQIWQKHLTIKNDISTTPLYLKSDPHYLRQVLLRFAQIQYNFPDEDYSDMKIVHWEKPNERLALTKIILKICKNVKSSFQNLPRVLKIQSPVYVFGDIHGNFKNIMTYNNLFWSNAPYDMVVNSLLLGDYVDRGTHSLECILFLFCLKLICPNYFHMLRGNHEDRSIQQQFTFYNECLKKFSNYGEIIWESINIVFDHMPFCAVVDEDIFCSHGGIPTSVDRIEYLYSIPTNLPLINSNQLAWEMVWNDPISNKDYKKFIEIFPINENNFPTIQKGFLPNNRRGTAYYFSEEAVNCFFELNNLSYIIRAHEVVPQGFSFYLDGKVITIFSSTNYCGCNNESAIAFVYQSKISIIQIDTNRKLIN